MLYKFSFIPRGHMNYFNCIVIMITLLIPLTNVYSFTYKCCETSSKKNFNACSNGFSNIRNMTHTTDSNEAASKYCKTHTFNGFIKDDNEVIIISDNPSQFNTQTPSPNPPPIIIEINSSKTITTPYKRSEHYDSSIKCSHYSLDLTKPFVDLADYLVMPNSPILTGDFNPQSQLIFTFNGKELSISPALRKKLKKVLINGPKDRCIIQNLQGEAFYTCHQFALNLKGSQICDNYRQVSQITTKTTDPAYSVEIITDFNNHKGLKSGDWIAFLDSSNHLVHSAIYLTTLETGEHLFISKLGVGPITISELNELKKEYPSGTIISKVTKIHYNATK